MHSVRRQLVLSFLVLLGMGAAAGQDIPSPSTPVAEPVQAPIPSVAISAPTPVSLSNPDSPAVQILRSFSDSDIKFNLHALMDTLRDKRHEGWVLAAYPDPKTSRPLIGAGFTLDLPAREHPQPDPLNAHPFLEPSSDDLWRAAGLAPQRLDAILDLYRDRLASWKKRKFQKRISTLEPQITDDEATLLLRISAIQAVYNARAYCRNFDQLTGSQQMALSQLVYQMGVNLAHFDQFLALINTGDQTRANTDRPATAQAAAVSSETPPSDNTEYWRNVQHSLYQSQWARHYRMRAIAVIAMLDPAYDDSPTVAEHRVSATLRPVSARRSRTRGASLTQVASTRSGGRTMTHKRKSGTKHRA
jgi:GH24 family phage-related lysozyme (muramidase)